MLDLNQIELYIGKIVVINDDREPWCNGEGILLSCDVDGVCRILWYAHQELSYHWGIENLKLKDKQEISNEISNDLREFVFSLQYKIISKLLI